MLSSLETPYLRIEHVCQSRSRSRQGEASDQEDGEHDVGEERGEVDDVARGLDALHGDQEHDDPSGQQAEHHPPPDAVESVDVGGDVQRLAVPGFAEKKEKYMWINQFGLKLWRFFFSRAHQKYWDSEDIWHSRTGTASVEFCGVNVGHSAHGRTV